MNYLNSPNIDYKKYSYETRDDTFSKFEDEIEKLYLDNSTKLSEDELYVCDDIYYDCQLFVPDPALRADSQSYFDENELKRRIRENLKKLKVY